MLLRRVLRRHLVRNLVGTGVLRGGGCYRRCLEGRSAPCRRVRPPLRAPYSCLGSDILFPYRSPSHRTQHPRNGPEMDPEQTRNGAKRSQTEPNGAKQSRKGPKPSPLGKGKRISPCLGGNIFIVRSRENSRPKRTPKHKDSTKNLKPESTFFRGLQPLKFFVFGLCFLFEKCRKMQTQRILKVGRGGQKKIFVLDFFGCFFLSLRMPSFSKSLHA